MTAWPEPSLGPLALSRSTVDRAAHLRSDQAAQDKIWSDRGTRVIVVAGSSALVDDASSPALRFLSPQQAPAGERFSLGELDGVAYGAVALAELPADVPSAGLREYGPVLSDRDAGLFVAAAALANWHATHRHCPRCGTATEVHGGGWVRRCPSDGSEHYPRTDSAVIMAVIDDDDRLLLGRQAKWPANRFSTLAGFVEPGESLEHAVRREVAEESGVVVGEVTYLGNQPWPFPASLMLGFRAHALSSELTLHDAELSDARWYTRDGLAADLAAGTLVLPGEISIARRLIEQWYGEEIAD